MLQFLQKQIAQLSTANKYWEQNECDHEQHHWCNEVSRDSLISAETERVNMNTSCHLKNFNSFRFEYFNFFYDSLNDQNSNLIVSISKEIIYCNVHTFMKQIKSYDMMSKWIICKNLDFCLREQMLSWHFTELNVI